MSYLQDLFFRLNLLSPLSHFETWFGEHLKLKWDLLLTSVPESDVQTNITRAAQPPTLYSYSLSIFCSQKSPETSKLVRQPCSSYEVSRVIQITLPRLALLKIWVFILCRYQHTLENPWSPLWKQGETGVTFSVIIYYLEHLSFHSLKGFEPLRPSQDCVILHLEIIGEAKSTIPVEDEPLCLQESKRIIYNEKCQNSLCRIIEKIHIWKKMTAFDRPISTTEQLAIH